MLEARMKRRVFGMLSKRLDEARLDEVADPRDPRGRRWPLDTLLRAVVIGQVAGCDSLAETERLTDEMTDAARQKLDIARRVPDTTMRDALCGLTPDAVRPCLHATVLGAHRRKALEHQDLPFGVASLDGKGTAVPACDDWFAQRQTHGEGPLVGVVRTITATLTSSRARPVIDVTCIPATTNEMGAFEHALSELVRVYGHLDLFRLVTYDAGACSKQNADTVRRFGLHYLFGLKGAQPTLYAEAARWLGDRSPEQADASSTDLDHGRTIVRRVYLGDAVAGFDGWNHLSTVLRVETEVLDARGERVGHENRYFISSLPRSRLTPERWLRIVRRHWGVETSHQILDTAFDEDAHPWIEEHPRATAVLIVLRRIAYTLLTLWRSVTLRSDEQRSRPWRALMRDVLIALITATVAQLQGLARRRPRPAPT